MRHFESGGIVLRPLWNAQLNRLMGLSVGNMISNPDHAVLSFYFTPQMR